MNKELGLTSVVRRIKTDYRKGTAYKMFENLVHQEFHAPDLNQKWCTDFTYLFLAMGPNAITSLSLISMIALWSQASRIRISQRISPCELWRKHLNPRRASKVP